MASLGFGDRLGIFPCKDRKFVESCADATDCLHSYRHIGHDVSRGDLVPCYLDGGVCRDSTAQWTYACSNQA